MKNSTRLLTILTLVIAGVFLFGTAVYAGNDDAPKTGFVDVDGDGFNDNMKDSNGDGIPNDMGEGSGEMGENANAYAYEYAEQLKNVHEIKHELFNERKGEFTGEAPEGPASWGDSGEGNLNPEWSDESGSVMDVGHKGSK